MIQGSLLQKSIKDGFLSALDLHITSRCVRITEPLCWDWLSQGMKHPGTLRARRPQASAVQRCKSSGELLGPRLQDADVPVHTCFTDFCWTWLSGGGSDAAELWAGSRQGTRCARWPGPGASKCGETSGSCAWGLEGGDQLSCSALAQAVWDPRAVQGVLLLFLVCSSGM